MEILDLFVALLTVLSAFIEQIVKFIFQTVTSVWRFVTFADCPESISFEDERNPYRENFIDTRRVDFEGEDRFGSGVGTVDGGTQDHWSSDRGNGGNDPERGSGSEVGNSMERDSGDADTAANATDKPPGWQHQASEEELRHAVGREREAGNGHDNVSANSVITFALMFIVMAQVVVLIALLAN